MTAGPDAADVRLALCELPDGTVLTVDACGDTSLIGTLVGPDDISTWANAQGLAAAVRADRSSGARTVVATYDSVFVEFDAERWSAERFAERLCALAEQAPFPMPTPRRRVIVPVVYGGEFGPDLPTLAATLGLSEAELVAVHSGTAYVVRSVVSPPGAPMLDAPRPLHGVPRLAVPRARVPAGSVAIAGVQCTVYATTSPGGWSLIGRTPCSLIDVRRPSPVAMAAGDLLEFHPLPAADWHRLLGRAPEVRGV